MAVGVCTAEQVTTALKMNARIAHQVTIPSLVQMNIVTAKLVLKAHIKILIPKPVARIVQLVITKTKQASLRANAVGRVGSKINRGEAHVNLVHMVISKVLRTIIPVKHAPWGIFKMPWNNLRANTAPKDFMSRNMVRRNACCVLATLGCGMWTLWDASRPQQAGMM